MKLAISAPRGKMGKLVTREALKRSGDFEIMGGIGPKGRDYIGCDMSVAAKTDFVGANTYDDVEKVVAMSDGVVDFSTTEGAMEVARACVKYRKPLMLGTTGFTEEQMAELEECAKTIPILIAHNTSKAVNLVYEIARMLTESIGGESDIEIIEMHDSKKLDAPSGTSKELGEIIAGVRGEKLADVADYGRKGRGLREKDHIGYHSVRAGDISSTHTLIFGMEGERIEITHRSYDFGTFAKGALDGILFLQGKKPGVYAYREVLGL